MKTPPIQGKADRETERLNVSEKKMYERVKR